MKSPQKAVIVTTTFTKDPVGDYRFLLALQMCQAARAYGYPVIVVDGSTSDAARDLLAVAGATVERQTEAGTGASRRQCIALGLSSTADVICWIEPEKVGMVPVLEPCVQMVSEGHDIVIPWRNQLFADYPPYQALSETWAAFEMAQITGLNLDFLIGPRIMSRHAAKLMMSYRGQSRVDPAVKYDDNWGILFVPLLWALQDGLKVGSCPVNYAHPTVQTTLEARDPQMDRKRDIQRVALVEAFRQEAELIGLKRQT